MLIIESLQERFVETSELQRTVILAPVTGAHHVLAVLVRVPAHHEFPLHTHPDSEDCFFVLSGVGEAIEPGRMFPISAPACVWVPSGHPHGLAAGAADSLCLVFEDHAEGKPETVFSVSKARQAALHPEWIRNNLPQLAEAEIVSILITPCARTTKRRNSI